MSTKDRSHQFTNIQPSIYAHDMTFRDKNDNSDKPTKPILEEVQEAPTSSATSCEHRPKFRVKKFETVALWYWKEDVMMVEDQNCAICKIAVTKPCVMCERETTAFAHCPVAVAPCRHEFHTHCSERWVVKHATCPLCAASWPKKWDGVQAAYLGTSCTRYRWFPMQLSVAFSQIEV